MEKILQESQGHFFQRKPWCCWGYQDLLICQLGRLFPPWESPWNFQELLGVMSSQGALKSQIYCLKRRGTQPTLCAAESPAPLTAALLLGLESPLGKSQCFQGGNRSAAEYSRLIKGLGSPAHCCLLMAALPGCGLERLGKGQRSRCLWGPGRAKGEMWGA